MKRVLATVVVLATMLVQSPRTTAQQRATFVPVTDAMLKNPHSRRLADVAADAEQLGLQPAQDNHPQQRPHSAHGVDARTRAWPPGGDAARATTA